MAFLLQAMSRASAAVGMDVTIAYSTGVGTPLGSCNIWAYNGLTAGDAQVTIAGAGYFNSFAGNLQVGDLIWSMDNAQVGQFYAVSAVQYPTGTLPGVVTFAAFGAVIGVIGTANIANAAVTFAKIQNLGAVSFFANPTGGALAGQNVTIEATNSLAFVGTTVGVNQNLLRYARVAMTAAQWNGMYAAPVQLVAAAGANTLIVIERVVEKMTFVAAAYAAGGVVGLQYDNTVHGAGDPATSTEAAADFFAGASTAFMQEGSLSTGAAFATSVNKGIFISNQTGAFTTGDGTWILDVWYRIVATV
jgi:hypothetical protein